MSSILLWFVGGFFLIAVLLLLREAYCFLHWKQSLGRLDEHEWMRTLTAIRNHPVEE
jgi:hypothetical protein